MEFKDLTSQIVFGETYELTMKELGKHIGTTPVRISKEAAGAGFHINGPQIWYYRWADGNPDNKFRLEIGFPVDQNKNHEKIKKLPGFRCASVRVEGSWDQFPQVYTKLIEDLAKEGFQPSEHCREVYHICDPAHPENCVTEIQLGIKEKAV